MLVIVLLLALASAISTARAETQVTPDQIRNWSQVSPNFLLPAGHPASRRGISLTQLKLPVNVVVSWNQSPSQTFDVELSWSLDCPMPCNSGAIPCPVPCPGVLIFTVTCPTCTTFPAVANGYPYPNTCLTRAKFPDCWPVTVVCPSASGCKVVASR